jgi:hypothetical protein
MKKATLIIIVCCAAFAAAAQDTGKVAQLEWKVKMLEQRQAKFERQLQAGHTKKLAEKKIKEAHKHVAAERAKFKAEDIARAETLYHRANRQSKPEIRNRLLDSVVILYPQLNRAGCAQLYLAQRADSNDKREQLLKDCIDRFSECYYLDGAQVGPLAMLQLARLYNATNREPLGQELIKRLRKEHRKAIGHDGRRLLEDVE